MVMPAPPGGRNFSPGDAIRDEALRRFRSPFVSFSVSGGYSSLKLQIEFLFCGFSPQGCHWWFPG
uniref:Uncharacterized protein n=1 Tax=Oryza meridionalis TaxID=40149 RepID=A0A0E0EWY6_9ORYZ